MSSSKELITPIIITHYSPKEDYGELAPPSSGIVNQTVQSMQSKFEGIPSPIAADPILIYNKPKSPESQNPITYLNNLKIFSNEKDIRFFHIENRGLRNGILNALSHVTTKYILFLEHDWKFTQYIPLIDILEMMNRYRKINYIRFNKRTNIEKNWDTIVRQDNTKPIPLCSVSSYSNNPHIARRSTYEKWIRDSKPTFATLKDKFRRVDGPVYKKIAQVTRIIMNKYILKQAHVGQFDGVEFVLDTNYKKKIEEVGFEQAHSEWGIYLYGAEGAGPFVQHLGGDY